MLLLIIQFVCFTLVRCGVEYNNHDNNNNNNIIVEYGVEMYRNNKLYYNVRHNKHIYLCVYQF